MAFTTIQNLQIGAGQAVKQELLTKVKDNFDDHEERILTLESSFTNFRPIEFTVLGTTGKVIIQDGLVLERVNFDCIVTSIRLFVWTAGTTGTLTVDLEYKRGGGAWTSLLSTPLQASYASGDRHVATGALAVSSFQLNAGDIVRLNVDAVQTRGNSFQVLLEFEGA